MFSIILEKVSKSMLELKTLELKNWCNLQDRTKTISFQKGFNVINGRNGSGKTSIVNAVSLLLLNRYEGSLEGFINNSCNEATAELTFSLNGKDTYVSNIHLKKAKDTSSERHLFKNGQEIASGENCAKELNKILPSFLTSYSLIYRQDSEDKVTECSDSDRRNLLTQLISLDYSEKVENFLTPTINKLKEQIQEKDKELYSLEHKEYLLDSEKEIKGTKHSQTEIDNLKLKIEVWERNERNKESFETLKKNLELSENDLKEIESKYDLKKLEQDKEKEIESLKKESQDKIDQISQVKSKAKEDSKKRMLGFLEEKSKLESENLEFKPVPENFDENSILETKTKISSLESRIHITEDNCKSLEKGICPVCKSDCKDQFEVYQKELSDLLQEKEKLQKDLSSLEEKKREVDEIISFNKDVETKKLQASSKLQNIQIQIDNEKKSIMELLQNYSEQENYIRQVEKEKLVKIEETHAMQIENSETIRNQKKEYVEGLRKQLEGIHIEEGLEDCRPQLEEILKTNAEIESCEAYNKAVRDHNATIRKQKEEDSIKKEVLVKGLLDLKNNLSDNQDSSEILKKTYPTWKLERDLKGLENKTNSFIEGIYKPLFVKFIANKNSLKMVYGEGIRGLSVKKLSGAERQIVDLAVENVFNQQQNLSCLILDESDSAMDNENKEAFFNAILSLEDYYEQIIVITHSKEIKDKLLVLGANTIIL